MEIDARELEDLINVEMKNAGRTRLEAIMRVQKEELLRSMYRVQENPDLAGCIADKALRVSHHLEILRIKEQNHR